jgi:hypothetical protein
MFHLYLFGSLGPKTMKLLVLMFLGFYLHVTFSMLLANIFIVRCMTHVTRLISFGSVILPTLAPVVSIL